MGEGGPTQKKEVLKIPTDKLMEMLGAPQRIKPKNEIKGEWTLQEIFGKATSHKIMTEKKIKKNGWVVSFDSKYNAIRINGRDEFNNYVAFNLWYDPNSKKINRISRDDSPERSQFVTIMLKFEDCQIFLPGTVEKLGVSKSELDTIKKEQEEFARLNQKLDEVNRSQLQELPSSYSYTEKNTYPVYQGEGVILSHRESNIGGLYTFGAGPCSILIVVSKGQTGETEKLNKIGMAHLDASVPLNDIKLFINRIKEGTANVEAYVISGEKNISLNVLKVLEATGAEIKFFNVDLSGERSDAAIVDSKGKVYYGERTDLNHSIFDSKKVEVVALARQMEQRLNITEK